MTETTSTSPSRRFAQAISLAINPLLLPPLLIAVVLAEAGADVSETLRISGGLAILLTLFPLGFLGWMARIGYSTSVTVVDRRQRVRPYLFGLACAVLALIFVSRTAETSAGAVFCITLSFAANTALLMSINYRWKISIHSAAAAGFLAALVTVSTVSSGGIPPYLYLLAPGVPLVMWARVHSGAHSVGEVFAGSALGLIVVPVELAVLHVIGLW
jgi:hypothetical protein